MIWATEETDGDRLVRKRAREDAAAAERISRNLKDLAQISDLTTARPKLIEAQETAERLRRQLESLREATG